MCITPNMHLFISFNNSFSNYQNPKDLQMTLLCKNIIDKNPYRSL